MAAGTTFRDTYKLTRALGATAKQSISAKAKCPMQAHHLISCSQMNKSQFSKVAKWARESGYDINRKSNGIALPAYFGHMRKKSLQRHNGGHQDIYYKKVREELQKIKDDLVDAKPCPNKQDKKNILGALRAAESSLRRRLVGRKIWLYDWSEELYEADYRDEGPGNLTRLYGRDDGYSAGLQWNVDYPRGQLRRRHTLKGTKAKVNDGWYKRFGYPVPRSTT